MKKLSLFLAVTLSMPLVTGTALCNNVTVSNVRLTGQDIEAQFTMVKFDIKWENSWRDLMNWDACWIFVKFSADNGPWYHAALDPEQAAPAGAQYSFTVPTDGKGVFIHRAGNGSGDAIFADVQLKWLYGKGGNGMPDNVPMQIKVFAIEMVYVPSGPFYIGQYPEGAGNYSFVTTRISSANQFPTVFVPPPDGPLRNALPTNLASAWPNGFNAFYCMKYEITQQQYADFLNTLSSTGYLNRVPSPWPTTNRYGISGTYLNVSSSMPNVACNFLDWRDGCAYADWAALRPMTEMEFEKACRGSKLPSNDYAWGSNIFTSATSITNEGGTNESPGNAGANVNGGSLQGVQGPMRVGCFGSSTSTRESSGASYYGIMELSGNLWEQVVILANRSVGFTGSVGDGAISAGNANANQKDWPGCTASGSVDNLSGGLRGGSWKLVQGVPGTWIPEASTSIMLVSDRSLTEDSYDRGPVLGFRCVRQAQ
jgi:formylglycine-generating enzyme required for sulfatase activity